MEKVLVSRRDAAERLGISAQTVSRLIRAGEVKSCRIGERRVMVDGASLDAYIQRQSTKEVENARE
jgi:excisionase family DNA binding protein